MFASWTGIQTDQFAFRVGNNDWSLASNFPLRRVPRYGGARGLRPASSKKRLTSLHFSLI
jgi:hypothetical protein